MKKNHLASLVVLAVLNVWDLVSTYTILFRLGSEYEANPVGRWLFETWPPLLVVFKVLLFILVIAIVRRAERRPQQTPDINVALQLMCLLYAVLAGWNLAGFVVTVFPS